MATPVEINIDVDTLKMSSSGAISADIWFVLSDQAFPADDWNDFVVVILTWWLTELSSLEKSKLGLARNLQFMDGPFIVHLLFDSNDEVKIECTERTATTTKTVSVGFCKASDIWNAVLSATEKILDAIEKRGWETVETQRLGDLYNFVLSPK